MSWILYFIYLAGFFYLIFRLKFFRAEGLKPWMPSAFFILKLIAGFAVWAIYTFYYTDRENSDIWKYFDDSKIISDAAFTNPGDFARMMTGIGDHTPQIDSLYYFKMNHWYQEFDNNLVNDAHIVIRFNAALRFISLGNYHIHSLFICFLAFIGLMAIYRTFYPALKNKSYALAAFVFLFPSLLFWGSGVLKEGLMLLAMGMIIFHAFAFFNDGKWKRIFILLLSAWLLFVTKFYVLAALIPALAGAWLLIKKPGNAMLKFSIVLLLFAGMGMSLKFISPNHDPLKILSWKQNDFVKLASGGTYLVSDSVVAFLSAENPDDLIAKDDSFYQIRAGADYMFWYFNPDFSDTFFVKNSSDQARYKLLTNTPRAGSITETDLLQPNLISFAKASPRAMVKSLFRPFPWEAKSILLLLPALENLLLPLLLLCCIFFYRRSENQALTGFCISFSLLLLLVMGLTTPVLGALVRYRIAALPFLLIGLLMLIDEEKLIAKFRKKK